MEPYVIVHGESFGGKAQKWVGCWIWTWRDYSSNVKSQADYLEEERKEKCRFQKEMLNDEV
jgi:hypothetical protein